MLLAQKEVALMLEIINATKSFDRGTPNEHIALDNMNLKVEKGEFVTILGSNGAGKSTLFNAICGSFLLDRGQIILDGKDITFLPEHRRASRIGRIFQDPMKGTAPGLSIEENLALAYSKNTKGMFRMAISRADREMFREKLSSFDMGLEDRMDTLVGLLSGGQRQVVTLLMSTIVTPDILLLDEHTAALDPATAQKVMDITDEIVYERHITTLMITHNMASALSTGTRTIMMDSGAKIFDFGQEERKGLSVKDLLEMYSEKKKSEFDNDRILLS